MSKVTFSYKGLSTEHLSSAQLSLLFDEYWGSENRSLPGYPIVIGHIQASCKNADGNIHHVTHIDELIKVYDEKLTAEIHIKGGVGENAPRTTFVYIPSKKKAGVAVTAEKTVASKYVDFLKGLFPMMNIPVIFISYATPELSYADYIKKILETRLGDKATVFVAKRSIKTGDHPFNVMLNKNLLKADALVPICTPLSKESNWLWWETSSVWTREGYVSPLFANISPDDFGEPVKSLYQGNDFFDPAGIERIA